MEKWLSSYKSSNISETRQDRIKVTIEDQQVGSVALLVARRTNDREVAGSRPTKVVCITVLTSNLMGMNCPLWPAATPSSQL